MELAVVICGIIACAVSITLGFKFYCLQGAELAKPISIVVWSGSVVGIITLIFSLFYQLMSPEVMALLRVFIFSSMMGAHLHLFKKTAP